MTSLRQYIDFDVIPINIVSGTHISNDSISPVAPWRVVNIGNSKPVALKTFLSVLEKKIGVKIKKNYLPMQQGDVLETFADISLLKSLTGFNPNTSLENGVEKFVTWYRHYNKIN